MDQLNDNFNESGSIFVMNPHHSSFEGILFGLSTPFQTLLWIMLVKKR
jgi:hypothetical protein